MEIVLVAMVVLLLLGGRYLEDLAEGLKKGIDEFRKASRDVQDEIHQAMNPDVQPDNRPPVARFSFALWIAQGFGLGRIPFAPGTFGSLAGLIWFALLLQTGSFWLYLAGTLGGLALSVWLCGVAEKILKQTDPGSVVLDEIAALPLCFLPWTISAWSGQAQLPEVESFFSGHAWVRSAIIFALFRLFDILKPWPIRQSQRLSGGWGVTADDVLAAACVALISVPFVL